MRFLRRNLGLLLSVSAFLLIVGFGTYELLQRRPERPDTLSGTLAFRTNRDANFEIYTWTVTERKATRLTSNPDDDRNPDFSWDGRLVAYESWQGGQADIIVADAVNGGGGPLTRTDALDTEPDWHPAGGQLAYVSDRGGTPSIYWSNQRGDQIRRLTGDEGVDSSPSWSPDGQRLVFASDRGGTNDLYILDFAGCQPPAADAPPNTPETCPITPLVVDGAQNTEPDWSRDGQRVAFTSTREGAPAIYMVNPDGNRLRRVIADITASEPAWSQEGGRIAYTTTLPSGETAVQVYDLARRQTENITGAGEVASQGTWRPEPGL